MLISVADLHSSTVPRLFLLFHHVTMDTPVSLAQLGPTTQALLAPV